MIPATHCHEWSDIRGFPFPALYLVSGQPAVHSGEPRKLRGWCVSLLPRLRRRLAPDTEALVTLNDDDASGTTEQEVLRPLFAMWTGLPVSTVFSFFERFKYIRTCLWLAVPGPSRYSSAPCAAGRVRVKKWLETRAHFAGDFNSLLSRNPALRLPVFSYSLFLLRKKSPRTSSGGGKRRYFT